jgi:hypothetical protein
MTSPPAPVQVGAAAYSFGIMSREANCRPRIATASTGTATRRPPNPSTPVWATISRIRASGVRTTWLCNRAHAGDEIAHAHRLRKAMAHPIGRRFFFRSSSLDLMLGEDDRCCWAAHGGEPRRRRRPAPKSTVSSICVIISSPELHSNDTCMCCRPACATLTGSGTLPHCQRADGKHLRWLPFTSNQILGMAHDFTP